MLLKTEERTLPLSRENEISVLGSLLVDGELFSDVRMILNPNDFYYDQNKIIYEGMCELYKNGNKIDQVTVAYALKDKLADIGGTAYLSHLIAEVPTSIHAEYYARIVKNLSVLRSGIKASHELENLGYELNDAKQYVVEFEKRILDLQKEVALPKLITPQELANRGAIRYNELNNGSRRGIELGFIYLDQALGGLFGGELCYLGARPSVGKTSVLLTIAQYASLHFGNILLASLEQPWGDILDRIVSSELEVSPRKIRAGNYSDDLLGDIILTMGKIADTKTYFYDSGGNIDGRGRNVSSIYSVASHMKTAYGLSAIFVDYLGLLSSDESWNRSRYEKVSEISYKLKTLAMDLDVPVICACQLNRQTETRIGEDRIPRINEMRDSGNIEADADTILFLYRDDYYEDLKEQAIKENVNILGKAKIIIGKHRQYGEVMGTAVDLKWDTKKRCYIDG
jgi:replicative DNA helicase